MSTHSHTLARGRAARPLVAFLASQALFSPGLGLAGDSLARLDGAGRTVRVALPFCHVRLTGRKPLSAAYPHQLRTLEDPLRKRRLDLGLFQREVADKLGVDEMTICNWETNRTSPQLRLIPRIIAFLGSVPDHPQVEGLGQQIVAARHRLGLSQRKLARRLGIDPSTLGWRERGRRQPSKQLISRLETFFAAHLAGAS